MYGYCYMTTREFVWIHIIWNLIDYEAEYIQWTQMLHHRKQISVHSRNINILCEYTVEHFFFTNSVAYIVTVGLQRRKK